ncbi:hypothetical protein HTZ97_14275 [Desulfuromonas acetoxidans]|uniref:Cadherin domain-containing protein n=1 Tax=Desulfuromonas acetoxidans (strain DSM 684 / 11070) TaxID=281689 RepID=Q1JWA0_DESA6|nr:hypothetical protein [Desulfuromonas acetoxidans]EAT14521.1 hypothetical protein Dace_0382 [Desulfuromonas acetoxidans DSM 684]MBF0645262.1 hypothetical protein [Desulfuromonas acetoxidans]NVD25568.1 hypothetical protein [Desulfuromonas acetoxidans]NVE17622.1 hypothetical protein [Desulfuromonas acetoxidans]
MLRRLLIIAVLSLPFTAIAMEERSPVVQLRYTPAPVNVLSGITVEPVVQDDLIDEVSFSYRWLVNGEEIDFEDSPFLSGDFFKRGDEIIVEVKAYGITGEEYPPFIPKPIYADNAPPQFTKDPKAEYDDDLYRGRVYAEDVDGDEVSYRLIEGPQNFDLDANSGRFQWQPEENEGLYPVKIEAFDPYNGRAEQIFQLELSTVRR